MQKIMQHVAKKTDITTFLGLCLLFYFVFFHNIWAYPLMDADETRYVSMARDMFINKDYLTLYLNGEYFFEKPPLYFWMECLSFWLFRCINEFSARFPVALLGSMGCILVYFMGKKIISRSYGVISSIILATSIEYSMLSKLAILDIVVSFCIAFSLSFGLATLYCRESRKKYYWWLFYIFSGLAVMAKGIPGFIVPFGSMFFIYIYAKKFKELFKPIYLIPGCVLFLLITVPWHLIMFKLHNPLFWNEYIIKHHLSRFIGADEINRSQPFYFYFVTLLWGFFPWIISSVVVWCADLKRFSEVIKTVNPFIIYNVIIVLFTLLFFTSSETKLITYILPLYPFLACLSGYIWWRYINEGSNEKIINTTNYIIASVFLVIALVGIVLTPFLPKELINDIGSLRIFLILVSFACGLALMIFTTKRFYIGVFTSLALFIILFSAIGTEKFYQVDYKFGQYDLMKFAQVAEDNNVSLTTFRFGTKYSLIYYGDMPVVYGPQAGIWDFKKALSKEKDFVIIKTKILKEYNSKDFVIIKQGKKYSLIDKRD